MKVHRGRIREYLGCLTSGAGASAPNPMADLNGYRLDALAMRRDAAMAGDLEWLRLSIDSLIANPAGRITQFAGQLYPFSDAELVEIFRHAYVLLWPDREPSEPGSGPDIEFAAMTDEEWDTLTGR